MPLSELDLHAARTGDTAAFERVVRACGRELRIFVAAHAWNADHLNEVCQATWVIVWEKLPTWNPTAPFDHWLRGIARNLLKRDLVARARQRAVGGMALLEQALAAEGLAGIDEDTRDARRLTRLASCLDRLSPRARAVVLARDREGVPLADLARRFKQPMGALATLLWRIRGGLRDCLDAS